jgi:hypothetical protein
MNIQLSNKSYEWYTPKHIIDMVLEVFPHIDLDPFSSEEANQTVGAYVYLTKEDDALSVSWDRFDCEYVFVNPPGPVKGNKSSRGVVRKAWEKTVKECSFAIWIGFSLEQLATLQDANESPLDFTTVILRKRLHFIGVGDSPTHSNYITLVARSEEMRDKFVSVFSRIGQVASVWVPK